MGDMIYDLCIIGAGMFGSAAARHASAVTGAKVCLIGPDEPTPEEKESREIFGAHYDEGRITRMIDNDSSNLTLSKESIGRYRELEKLSGISFYHPVGTLWIGKKDSQGLKNILQTTSALNIPVVDLSYNDIFSRRYPYIKLKKDDCPILDDCGAGHISPRNMVAAQKKVAEDQGCVLIHKVVNEVSLLTNGIHEVITEDNEKLKAKRILICTGAFTNFKNFPMPKLKIYINKETVAFFKIPLEEAKRLSAMPSIIYSRRDIEIAAYILPPIKYPDGNYYLKIGHVDFEEGDLVETLEEVRNWYLSKGDSKKVKALSKVLTEMLPGVLYEETSEMTCVTSYNPSGQPYIDRVSPTVTVATVGSAGAKICDEVGRIATILSDVYIGAPYNLGAKATAYLTCAVINQALLLIGCCLEDECLRYEEIRDMTCVTCENPIHLPYIDRISPTVTAAVVGNGMGAKFSDEVGRLASLSVNGLWKSDLCKSQFRAIYENETLLKYSKRIMDDTVYDLCIVGAGMFGSAAARHASATVEVKVCLIGPDEPTPQERSTREIFSAHYDEGRITRTIDEDMPSQILSKHAINRYRELERLSGIDFYHPVGLLYVTQKNSSYSKKLLQSASSLDLPVVDLSYNDIFKKRFSYIKLREDDHPLLDDFGAGHISPRNMVAAQKKVAKSQGCDIIPEVVNEIKPLVKGMHEVITAKGRIVKAKRILICTGAFTNLKKFPMPKLKMKIQKETVAFLKLPAKEAQRLSAMPSIIYNRSEEKFGAYVLPPIQYPDGNCYLKIGHSNFGDKDSNVETLEEIKRWYLSKGDPEEVKILSNFLTHLLPGISCEGITEMTCVTSHSPSGQPYIDRVSPTVTVAAVANGKGAKFSDEVGRIAATLSLTGRWDSELSKSNFEVVFEN